MMHYAWVDSRKAEGFPVVSACRVAEVSTSAYYEHKVREAAGATEADWDEAILINEMWDIHNNVNDSYGSPRMHTALSDRGFCHNHKKTERLMAQNGVYAVDGRRKKVKTTIPDVSAPPLPDLVKRDFSTGEPGKRTCGDITYIPTDEGWLYLADVLDIGSRRIIGYAMDARMETKLVSDALEMAITTRGGKVKGMIFHGDRGSQGEFNWSSQHLNNGGAKRWVSLDNKKQLGQFVGKCIHRDGRQPGIGTRCRGSGSRSQRGFRVRTLRSPLGYHPGWA